MMDQLLRFCGVGAVGTATHVMIAMVSDALFQVPALGANLIGFCAAVLVSYFGHARITFGLIPQHTTHLPRFILSALGALAASSFITWLVHDWLGQPFWIAMAVVASTVPTITFLLFKLWVFKPQKEELDLYVNRRRTIADFGNFIPCVILGADDQS